MTTSGSFSFTCNRDQVIRQSMLNIGRISDIETPTAQEVSDCNFLLNMMVKQWMGRTDFAPGLKVWTRKWGYLFLSGTTGKYSVGPTAVGWTNSFVNQNTTATALAAATAVIVPSTTGIVAGYNIGIQLDSGTLFWTTVLSVVGTTVNLVGALPSQSSANSEVFVYQTAAQQPETIETVVLRDQFNEDTPVRIMRSVADYANLPSKTDTQNIADPTAIYYEWQLGNSNLYTDCGAANDVTKYLVMSYLEPIQDMVNPADNFEYPQQYFLALTWGLSKQIAPMFNMPWTQLMEANFQSSVQIAGRKDPEVVTLFFQPGED